MKGSGLRLLIYAVIVLLFSATAYTVKAIDLGAYIGFAGVVIALALAASVEYSFAVQKLQLDRIERKLEEAIRFEKEHHP